MSKSSVRPAGEIEKIVKLYGNMLFRLCLIMLGNPDDAEDAVQETFIKYLQKAPEFRDAEHEKAWLITVATNKCRDMLRFKNRHQAVNIEVLNEFTSDSADSGILEALMSLPEKFKIVDVSGNVVFEGNGTDRFEIIDGQVNVEIPTENIADGAYKFIVNSFVGASKADQPLEINGLWECEFTR